MIFANREDSGSWSLARLQALVSLLLTWDRSGPGRLFCCVWVRHCYTATRHCTTWNIQRARPGIDRGRGRPPSRDRSARGKGNDRLPSTGVHADDAVLVGANSCWCNLSGAGPAAWPSTCVQADRGPHGCHTNRSQLLDPAVPDLTRVDGGLKSSNATKASTAVALGGAVPTNSRQSRSQSSRRPLSPTDRDPEGSRHDAAPYRLAVPARPRSKRRPAGVAHQCSVLPRGSQARR
jgi:hypothetical protein